MNTAFRKHLLKNLKEIIRANFDDLLKRQQVLMIEQTDDCVTKLYDKLVAGVDYFYEEGKKDKEIERVLDKKTI